ncbi:uncharacterized protein LOC131311954 isoform X2 [Rhododendron vialii]|uniref:uncharacterized protein LOC131311954 isoform X2 n=1 Tax=Rhododendron vialii TaxID=182163 RepID=UPI00265DBFEC|nr:uncharacterized protein LOC131311954 isoform X2 [Rhododendron vialii]
MTEVDGQEVFNLEDEAHVKLQKEQRPHKISFYVEKVYALKPRKAALENLQQRGQTHQSGNAEWELRAWANSPIVNYVIIPSFYFVILIVNL